MDDTAERLLCCVRISNADLIVTSERFVHQSLTFAIWFFHFIFGVVFFFAPSEAIFGMESSAWSDDGQKLFGGEGFFGPSANSQKIINQSRIIHSLPFDTIKEVNIQPRSGGSTVSLTTKDKEIVFALSDDKAGILFHFLQGNVGNRIKFINEEHKKRISELAKRYTPKG